MNTNAVWLCDHHGERLRLCPLGPLQALEAVYRRQASIADVQLDLDREGITVTYGPRRYTYRLVAAVPVVVDVPAVGRAA